MYNLGNSVKIKLIQKYVRYSDRSLYFELVGPVGDSDHGFYIHGLYKMYVNLP